MPALNHVHVYYLPVKGAIVLGVYVRSPKVPEVEDCLYAGVGGFAVALACVPLAPSLPFLELLRCRCRRWRLTAIMFTR